LPPTSVRGLLAISFITYDNLTLISKAGAVAGQTGEPEERAASMGVRKLPQLGLQHLAFGKHFPYRFCCTAPWSQSARKPFVRIGHTLSKLMQHVLHMDTKL